MELPELDVAEVREMAERIARKHKDAAATMWIGTFHAFGLDLIRRFHADIGLAADPRIPPVDRSIPRVPRGWATLTGGVRDGSRFAVTRVRAD